nr:MAG TPA: hypothetical protein [Caudoviricetes sp.]
MDFNVANPVCQAPRKIDIDVISTSNFRASFESSRK